MYVLLCVLNLVKNSKVLYSYCANFCYAGFARRTCISERMWGAPNVSQCQTVEQIRLRMRAEELSDLVNNVFESEDRDLTQTFEPEIIVDITEDLEAVTNTSQPILPNDLTSASETLNIVLQ